MDDYLAVLELDDDFNSIMSILGNQKISPASSVLKLKPSTLHPTPYTLKPHTLHPTPYTLNPKP